MGSIDALIEAGADIEKHTLYGWTPLGAAARHSQRKAMHTLLQHGASPDVQDDQGDSLLHLACRGQVRGLDAAVDLLLRLGADETATNKGGRTPLELLSPTRSDCSPEEIERARLLLARARADRAWRRQYWLVMLRSRASKARTAGRDNGGGGGHGSISVGGRGESEGSNMARGGQAEGGESGVPGPAGNGRVVGAGGDGEGEGLRAVVASLIELELDGVFRTVVGFL